MGVRGRWRGSGRRGLRAAKAFCLKTNKKTKYKTPANYEALRTIRRACSHGPARSGAEGLQVTGLWRRVGR